MQTDDCAYAATAFCFLRRESKPRTPRPPANSGKAAGNGVGFVASPDARMDTPSIAGPKHGQLISELPNAAPDPVVLAKIKSVLLESALKVKDSRIHPMFVFVVPVISN